MISPRTTERWAIQILESIHQMRFAEDSRVELKRAWPDSYSMARRLAGHGNAAGGSDILWLIGVDEKEGIVEIESGFPDLADEMPKVFKFFDGPSPSFVDRIVEFEKGRCIAIAVDTTFAPFVVRNPEHGKSKGHVIDFEIPWRSGSRIRSARRDEIIRLLATDFTSPDIEVLKASITSSAMAAGKMFCQLEIEFYIMPLSETRLELPLHRIQGALKPDISDDWFKIRDFNFRGLYSGELTTIGGSRQFRRSADEKFIVTSSGITVMAGTKGHVTAKLSIPEDTWHIANSFDVLFSFEAGRERIPFDLTCSIDKNAGAAP